MNGQRGFNTAVMRGMPVSHLGNRGSMLLELHSFPQSLLGKASERLVCNLVTECLGLGKALISQKPAVRGFQVVNM